MTGPNRESNKSPKGSDLTVIVPAYNEGKHMLKTLRSVLKSDYPINKLQIIAINDGSADDTLSWIQKACAESAGRIEMINFKKNRGKIFTGFNSAQSAIKTGQCFNNSSYCLHLIILLMIVMISASSF